MKFIHRAVTCAGAGLLAVTLSTAIGNTAFAAPNPSGTGQPSQECGEEDTFVRPGHADTARGSAFNPDGIAGMHYAGEQPQNSKNEKSVSQYDVACFQVTTNLTR